MSPTHQNRGRTRRPADNPRPDDIRAAREAAGLTQTAAGAIIYCSMRGWQQWESGERPMHPAFWELFGRKIAERPG